MPNPDDAVPRVATESADHPVAVDTSAVSASFDRRKSIIAAIVTLVTLAVVFVGIIPKFGSYAEA